MEAVHEKSPGYPLGAFSFFHLSKIETYWSLSHPSNSLLLPSPRASAVKGIIHTNLPGYHQVLLLKTVLEP